MPIENSVDPDQLASCVIINAINAYSGLIPVYPCPEFILS